MPEPTVQIYAYRRKKGFPSLAKARPIINKQTKEPVSVESKNTSLDEYDLELQVSAKILTRNGMMVEESFGAPIRMALLPESRGAFMEAMDQAFKILLKNLKTRYATLIKEPEMKPLHTGLEKTTPGNGNDRRRLGNTSAERMAMFSPVPPLAKATVPYPDQLPPKPVTSNPTTPP